MSVPLGSNGFEILRWRANGIEFHGAAAGPAHGPLVVLLHGFPEFWYGWRHQIGALAGAGLRVVAPDQRGYNLSAKPASIAAYHIDWLADDVISLAEALERDRFAVVGHDWGGVVAWHLAGRNPERVRHAAILNAPHPAVVWPYARTRPSQLRKSWYVGFFQTPLLPELALRAGDFFMLRRTLLDTSRPATFAVADWPLYRAAWGQPGALTGGLNWYRALRLYAGTLPPSRIRVPVRVIWGDRDAFLDRSLAEAGAALCDRAGVIHLRDATHWLQHEEPQTVNRLLIEFVT